MTGGREKELRYALYRDGDFVSYENCLAYLHDSVPKQLPSFLDSKDGGYTCGTSLPGLILADE